jgi:hypothetical protein
MKIPTLIWLAALLAITAVAPGQSSNTVTKADYEKWMKDLSNWGRWGKDDQMGSASSVSRGIQYHYSFNNRVGDFRDSGGSASLRREGASGPAKRRTMKE